MERDWLVLTVDKKHMSASLSLVMPKSEECPIFSEESIEEYLRENGIVVGIDYAAISALSNTIEYGRSIVVAKGVECRNGEDGYYRYLVRLEDEKDKPKINEDGSVDYYNSLRLAMVKEDEVVAVYVPPTDGEDGFSIYGEVIPARKGKEARPLSGTGIKKNDEDGTYLACYDGRIFRKNEKIVVEKVYVVNGDLSIEKGNIKFNGDVEIKGDVRSGLQIDATGSIFVHGHVGSCRLVSGGSITVKEGAQGRDKCYMMAKGDIALSFAERCTIVAEGSVYADSLLSCRVMAKGTVTLKSKLGIIVGGEIYAMNGVFAKQLGKELAVPTELKIGPKPEFARTILEKNNELKKLDSELTLLEKKRKQAEEMEKGPKAKEAEAIKMKIFRTKILIAAEQKKLAEEKRILEEQYEESKNEAVVEISGVVYPGATISMGQGVYYVRDVCKAVRFRYVNMEMIMEALS